MSIVINANVRTRVGKGASRAVRRDNLAPAVIYGLKKTPEPISVDVRDIMKVLHTGRFFNTVIEINVDNKKQKVLARDVQFHPVKDTIEHVDFMRVSGNSKVKVVIPINYKGVDVNPYIKMGGKLQVVRRDIELLCPADSILKEVVVDVTKFKFNQPMRISIVELPENIDPVVSDRDFVLATIKSPRGVSSDEDEDEETESEAEESKEES